jgi:signal transduction histidine kinase
MKPAAPRTSRALFIAFAAVVVSFLGATTLTMWSATGIHAAADSIGSNAAPSLVELAEARQALRHLQVRTIDVLDRGGPRSSLAEIARLDHVLDAKIRGYERLPSYPEERGLWPPLSQALGTVRARVADCVARIERGPAAPGETRELSGRLNVSIDQLDTLIEREREINATNSKTAAARIDRLYTRAIVIGFGLDALSVALTVIAAHLARRVVRGHAAALEERARELEQFATRVAHDLLSPLTAVSLAFDVGQKLSPDPKAQDVLARGRASLRRTRQLADGLLAFARAGARPEPGGRADLTKVITGVLDDESLIAEERGVTLVLEPGATGEVACSPGVLTSVVGNLVQNAVKYVGDGPGRRVAVRAHEATGRVRVEVEDNGPGIPPEMEHLIFEPFVRGPGADLPGIGLGLATVRRMVQAHGGAVGVVPAPSGGSVFWFELPRAGAEAREGAAALAPASGQARA